MAKKTRKSSAPDESRRDFGRGVAAALASATLAPAGLLLPSRAARRRPHGPTAGSRPGAFRRGARRNRRQGADTSSRDGGIASRKISARVFARPWRATCACSNPCAASHSIMAIRRHRSCASWKKGPAQTRIRNRVPRNAHRAPTLPATRRSSYVGRRHSLFAGSRTRRAHSNAQDFSQWS